AERRLLMKTTREEAIQSISDSGDDKRYQRQNKLLVEKQRDKDWYQRHPKDGQHVWQGDNPRGHETISDFEFAIADWAKRRPRASTHLRNNQAGAGEISHYRWISHAKLCQAAQREHRHFRWTAVANRQDHRSQSARDIYLRVPAPS